MKLALLFCLLAGSILADSITTRDGETLSGEIIEQTDTLVVIRLANDTRTILFTREIPRAEITALHLETAAAKAERRALDQYRLGEQELTIAAYRQGISALGQLPATPAIRQRLDDYRAELRRVEERQVKFAGRWMSPAARDEAYRQLARVAQHQRLARLEAEHDQLAKGLEEARGSLNATEAALANLPDIVVPIVEYRLVTVPATDWRFVPWVEYEPWVVGEQVYPNPKRPELASNQRFYAKQIADGEARLAQLREQIAGLRDQLTDPAARQ